MGKKKNKTKDTVNVFREIDTNAYSSIVPIITNPRDMLKLIKAHGYPYFFQGDSDNIVVIKVNTTKGFKKITSIRPRKDVSPGDESKLKEITKGITGGVYLYDTAKDSIIADITEQKHIDGCFTVIPSSSKETNNGGIVHFPQEGRFHRVATYDITLSGFLYIRSQYHDVIPDGVPKDLPLRVFTEMQIQKWGLPRMDSDPHFVTGKDIYFPLNEAKPKELNLTDEQYDSLIEELSKQKANIEIDADGNETAIIPYQEGKSIGQMVAEGADNVRAGSIPLSYLQKSGPTNDSWRRVVDLPMAVISDFKNQGTNVIEMYTRNKLIHLRLSSRLSKTMVKRILGLSQVSDETLIISSPPAKA